MTDSQLKTAKQLYKPSNEVVNMVGMICALLDKKGINGVRFDSTLMLGDLQVKWIERENSHCALLVHWYPNYNLSLRDDPFCSAYVLSLEEINEIYSELKRILL